MLWNTVHHIVTDNSLPIERVLMFTPLLCKLKVITLQCGGLNQLLQYIFINFQVVNCTCNYFLNLMNLLQAIPLAAYTSVILFILFCMLVCIVLMLKTQGGFCLYQYIDDVLSHNENSSTNKNVFTTLFANCYNELYY